MGCFFYGLSHRESHAGISPDRSIGKNGDFFWNFTMRKFGMTSCRFEKHMALQLWAVSAVSAEKERDD